MDQFWWSFQVKRIMYFIISYNMMQYSAILLYQVCLHLFICGDYFLPYRQELVKGDKLEMKMPLFPMSSVNMYIRVVSYSRKHYNGVWFCFMLNFDYFMIFSKSFTADCLNSLCEGYMFYLKPRQKQNLHKKDFYL